MNLILRHAVPAAMVMICGVLTLGCNEKTDTAPPSAPDETTVAQPAATTQPAETPAALKDLTPKIFAAEKAAGTATAFDAAPAFGDDFNPDWKEAGSGWRVATWKQNGAQMSPDRCKVDGNGCMVQTVLAGEPYRGGSMQTDREFGYGRWVARVKPTSVPGVLNSIFTKDWDNLKTPKSVSESDGNKFEIDIELLSYTFGPGKGKVHLALHDDTQTTFSQKHPFTEDPDLDFNPSDDFHEWGFDIYPDRIAWHVDGKVFKVAKAPEGKSITDQYEFFFNSWTQPKWIKGPPKEDAHYLIDWVRFYPLKETK